ncbi:riboflavin synthase [Halomicrobium mukohataei]|uniref:Riboflavin synthase n=1 Tax=Halomicrobium mukohataei TaxID=57705 RepID=A0A847U964_9EURY|nr:riboflavin synthase [Halomicrobium mukohataei]NLV08797.1 riboflavin synthase [Halomicrobium mukohataei]
MFTGIVEATGEVRAVEDTADGRRLRIGTDFADLSHGQSISVSGACLTVEEFEPGEWFSVFLAEETIDRTFFDAVAAGDTLNLERAMPADGRFDGHIVQGHVDATATVEAIERVGGEDGDWRFTFSLPADVERYVVEKGSITVDGISLTVADRREDSFAVAIIPTTYDVTTLSEKSPGDAVHLEVDVVAKYVERMV